MITLIIIGSVLLGWALCGALTYSITFAYFQRKWPLIAAQDYTRDRNHARLGIFLGPLGLGAAMKDPETIKIALERAKQARSKEWRRNWEMDWHISHMVRGKNPLDAAILALEWVLREEE